MKPDMFRSSCQLAHSTNTLLLSPAKDASTAQAASKKPATEDDHMSMCAAKN